MQKQDRKALTAVLTAVLVLFWSAFAPQSPRAAWWCTAFSITCEEAAGESRTGSDGWNFGHFWQTCCFTKITLNFSVALWYNDTVKHEIHLPTEEIYEDH